MDVIDGEEIRLQEIPDRWTDYGDNPNILNISKNLSVEELKRIDIFSSYDDAFLKTISPDITIVDWKAGSILFEEGSYIDLAFYILNGSIKVYLKHLENDTTFNRPIFNQQTQLFNSDDKSTPLRKKEVEEKTVFRKQVEDVEKSGDHVLHLTTIDIDIENTEHFLLKKGDFLGEIGALNGWPQSVTAQTTSECKLCQIRLPALQEMRYKSTLLKERLDKIYRERSLFAQLQKTPIFQHCDAEMIDQLKRTVGLVSLEPNEPLVKEEDAAGELFLVRSGFLKISQKVGEGNITVSYLSKGMTFGEVELMLDNSGKWQYSATSVGHSELVRINKVDFDRIINSSPKSKALIWNMVVSKIKETGYGRRNLKHSELVEFALGKGLVQGNSILLIDLETCVRCDDCVRGCASAHQNRPRFVREGEKYGKFLIARSCYHCEDPVCLIGCPTGAIRRANVEDVVEINEKICIGCGNCATRCPYDAIVMHDTGNHWPNGDTRLVASKCDLCYTSKAGPACVKNCPQDSAIRINNLTEFQQLLSGSEYD